MQAAILQILITLVVFIIAVISQLEKKKKGSEGSVIITRNAKISIVLLSFLLIAGFVLQIYQSQAASEAKQELDEKTERIEDIAKFPVEDLQIDYEIILQEVADNYPAYNKTIQKLTTEMISGAAEKGETMLYASQEKDDGTPTHVVTSLESRALSREKGGEDLANALGELNINISVFLEPVDASKIEDHQYGSIQIDPDLQMNVRTWSQDYWHGSSRPKRVGEHKLEYDLETGTVRYSPIQRIGVRDAMARSLDLQTLKQLTGAQVLVEVQAPLLRYTGAGYPKNIFQNYIIEQIVLYTRGGLSIDLSKAKLTTHTLPSGFVVYEYTMPDSFEEMIRRPGEGRSVREQLKEKFRGVLGD